MKLLRCLLFCLVLGGAGRAAADTVIVFNEVMYHPLTNETALEWLELHNQMAVDVDISGWELTGGVDFTFAEGTVVAGGGYVVVAIDPAALAAELGVTGAYGPFVGRLANNGETLRLRNNSRRIVDELDYDVEGNWPVAPDGSGVSLAKRRQGTASGPAANWTWSDQVGGTPGEANFPLLENPAVPEVLIATDAVWNFEDSGADLGSAWREAGFDDTAWESGSVWFYHGTITTSEERRIPTLFNSGVGADGNVLSPGAADPHYTLTEAAQGTVGSQAVVMDNNDAWNNNTDESSWIGVVSSGATGVAGGAYHFQTTFDLDGFLADSALIRFKVAVDNNLNDVLLNGTPLGFTHDQFDTFSPTFEVSSGFVEGENELEFASSNISGPGGFRVELEGVARQVLTNTPVAAAPTTHYFRRPFEFQGDPATTELTLSLLVDDGAIVYLNGAEIARVNMPAGEVSATTPALENVLEPAKTGLVIASPPGLVAGENVLAVEVHQSSDGGEDMLFAAQLFSTALPPSVLPLALNEVAGVTNETFFLELANTGTNALPLEGYSLVRDGVTNQTFLLDASHVVPAGGFLVVDGAASGFVVEDEDRLFLYAPGQERVVEATLIKNSPRARFPDGDGPWLRPSVLTPGAPNQVELEEAIVINEILYHPPLLPPTNGLPAAESPEAWIELYNRGDQNVDLGGWRLEDGVEFSFPAGTILAPGEYLLVAEDAAFLSAKYPGVRIAGQYNGRLSGRSDRLVLEDAIGNPADVVEYFDDGRWPEYADGGGSSLELRDPVADNAAAEAWAASDTSGQTPWETYRYRMVATIPSGSGQPTTWSDFVLGLLAAGECLVDDLSVVKDPDGTAIEVIGNGDFEAGISGWRPVGTHVRSSVIADPANAGNQVLHVVATGPQEHMHNHIETTLANNQSIDNGATYEVSYRARWLAGNNLLNTRLYFNRVARTTRLPVPSQLGTPGAPNSRLEPNIGPTFVGLRHEPVTPQVEQPVVVSVRAADPQGVARLTLWWSEEGSAWTSTAMTDRGNGLYQGTIPGLPAGRRVQFHVRGEDGLGAVADFPARGRASGALYVVEDGQANLGLTHNLRIILSPDRTDLLHALTNVQSNARLPGTVVWNEERAYYNVGVRLKGSQRGRDSDTRVSFHLTFPPEDPFRGVHPVMLVDRSGAGDSSNNKQEEILIKHILHRAGGVPGAYADMIWVIAPRAIHTEPAQLLPRFEDEFIETAYEDGGDGNLWELELIYYPTTDTAEGYKLPSPDQVVGTDIQDLGDDKEIYRYNFIIKKDRDRDHYDPFITFAKTFSEEGEVLDSQVEQVMDVDQWMRVWALVTLCGVGDSYTFGNNHNLMMYLRPSDERFLAFPWDMDFSFVRGTSSALIGDQNLSKIIRRPRNLRRFYGHIQDIIERSFNSAYMTPWASHYESFAPGQNYGSVPGYINNRGNYALSVINSAGGNSDFAIDGPESLVVSNNLLRLSGTAPVAVQDIRVNGVGYDVAWTGIDTWELAVPLQPGTNHLSLSGLDVRGEPLPSATAGVTASFEGAAVAPDDFLVLNEILYRPNEPSAAFVELLNRSLDTSFDISGWRINGLSYRFPEGSLITNGQHLVLAESRPAFLREFQSRFPAPADVFDGRLDLDGETLSLQKPVSVTVTNAMGGVETNRVFVDVDKVRYEAVLPWPEGPNSSGSSLALVDAEEDNSRVSNWADGSGWQSFVVTRQAGSFATRLILALAEAGEVYIDDVQLVLGSEPGVGVNVLENGGFESGTLSPWMAQGNHDGSSVTSDVAVEGDFSLHLVATGGGTTRDFLQQGFGTLDSDATYTLSLRYLPVSPNRLKWRISSLFSDFNVGVSVFPTRSTPGTRNTPADNLPPYDPVWLNEAAPVNQAGLADNAGDLDPWIELYNRGSEPVSLEGYFLANNYNTNLLQWAFPGGASIDPGAYKVVWLDGEPGESTAEEWHASFRLDVGTGNLALVRVVDSRPQITDYLTWSGLATSRSYGDFPDGQPFQRIAFDLQTPGAPNVGRPADLFINEWLASNAASLQDPADGNYEDWFEIFNAGPDPVELGGYFLTDDFDDKNQYQIPEGFRVPGGGHLLVWADNDPEQSDPLSDSLHANFALNAGGEVIGLYSPQGIAVDEIRFGAQTNDISEGRFPDGSANREFMTTVTPGAPNIFGMIDNQPPQLALPEDQTLFLGQTLSLILNATDPDLPGQTLSFGLGPGAPAGMTVSTAGLTIGLLEWTPTDAQAPSTNQVTATVTDDGMPARSDEATFTVIVLRPPVVAILAEAGQVRLEVPSQAGISYQLWAVDSLEEPIDWQPVGEPVTATDATLVITDEIGAGGQRFYQVQPIP